MNRTFPVLALFAAQSAFAAPSDDLARYSLLVSGVEPLHPPIFERAERPLSVASSGATESVSVRYRVRSAELRGRKLIDEITRLFRDAQWTEGMAPGVSVAIKKPNGQAEDVIGFHKEPLLRTPDGRSYCTRFVYLIISDDQTSIRCTYSFPSSE